MEGIPRLGKRRVGMCLLIDGIKNEETLETCGIWVEEMILITKYT